MQHIPIHITSAQRGGQLATADVKAANCNGHFRRRAIMKCLAFATATLVWVRLGAQSTDPSNERHHPQGSPPDQAANPVLQWNKALLVIVRTHGAQPATIHPTRSFALMHAAIYDAVNAIDGTHEPYLVHLTDVSRRASQDAAAAAAAHEILAQLYPAFQAMLDAQLQESLGPIPDGADQTEAIILSQSMADSILALRRNDGS